MHRSVLLIALFSSISWQAVAAGLKHEDPAGRATAVQLTGEARELWSTDQLSQASAKLEAALAADGSYLPAHQLMAVTLQQQGNVDEAVDHYWTVQRGSFTPLPADAPEEQTAVRELLVQCEGLLVLLANAERLKAGLRPYLPDPRLAIIARQHSDEMRDLGYFSHESPVAGYETIQDRFLRVFTDLLAYSIGENIACKYGRGIYSLNADSAHDTHQDWMESPGHRSNIMSDEFTYIGIGLSANENGDYWATQFFASF